MKLALNLSGSNKKKDTSISLRWPLTRNINVARGDNTKVNFIRAKEALYLDDNGKYQLVGSNEARVTSNNGLVVGPAITNKCECYSMPGADQLGPEFLTASEQAFDAQGRWMLDAGWSISNGKAQASAAASYNWLSLFEVSPSGERIFEITFELVEVSAGGITLYFDEAIGTSRTTPGIYSERLIASWAGDLSFVPDETFTGSIDNVSIREVGGTDENGDFVPGLQLGTRSYHDGSFWHQNIQGMTAGGDAASELSVNQDVIFTEYTGQSQSKNLFLQIDNTWVNNKGANTFDTNIKMNGSQSIQLSSGTPASQNQIKKTGLNLTMPSDKLTIWCYSPQVVDDHASYFSILLSSDSGYANHWVGGAGFGISQHGWFSISIKRADFTKIGSPTEIITDVLIRMVGATDDTFIYVDENIYADSIATPTLIFTNDDSGDSIYTHLYPRLSAADIVSTSFIVTDWVNGPGDVLTTAMLDEMYANGWEIANHSSDHTSMGTVTTAERLAKIKAGYDQLIAWGYERSAKYFAYPGGSTGTGTPDFEANPYITAAFTTSSFPIETGSGKKNRVLLPREISLAQGITPQNIKDKIDSAIAYGETCILIIHGIVDSSPGTYDYLATELQEIIDYAVAKRAAGELQIKSVREWYEGLGSNSLSQVNPDSKIYDHGNLLGSTDATVEIDGATGNTNPHITHIYKPNIADIWERETVTLATPLTTDKQTITTAAGQRTRFVVPELIEPGTNNITGCPPVLTYGAAETQAADNLYYTLTDEINGDEYTILFEFTSLIDSADFTESTILMRFTTSGVGIRINPVVGGTKRVDFYEGPGALNYCKTDLSSEIVAGVTHKVALRGTKSGNQIQLIQDGVAGAAVEFGGSTLDTKITLGTVVSSGVYIKNITIRDICLTEDECVVLTSW